jgi:hypothetical protein
MPSLRWNLADDVCPVSDELLGELCRANHLFVPCFESTLAPDVRALLALFCYRRSHLHSMGLAIAAVCDEDHLVSAGQGVGEFLFASSREVSPAVVPETKRSKITLARGVLRVFAIDDDLVLEANQAVRPVPGPLVDIASGGA